MLSIFGVTVVVYFIKILRGYRNIYLLGIVHASNLELIEQLSITFTK